MDTAHVLPLPVRDTPPRGVYTRLHSTCALHAGEYLPRVLRPVFHPVKGTAVPPPLPPSSSPPSSSIHEKRFLPRNALERACRVIET